MNIRITAAGDEAVGLDVDGAPREVRYADVAKALVQVELNRRLTDDEDDEDDDVVADETDDDEDEDR